MIMRFVKIVLSSLKGETQKYSFCWKDTLGNLNAREDEKLISQNWSLIFKTSHYIFEYCSCNDHMNKRVREAATWPTYTIKFFNSYTDFHQIGSIYVSKDYKIIIHPIRLLKNLCLLREI